MEFNKKINGLDTGGHSYITRSNNVLSKGNDQVILIRDDVYIKVTTWSINASNFVNGFFDVFSQLADDDDNVESYFSNNIKTNNIYNIGTLIYETDENDKSNFKLDADILDYISAYYINDGDIVPLIGLLGVAFIKIELVDSNLNLLNQSLDYDVSFNIRIVQGSNDWDMDANDHNTAIKCKLYDVGSEYTYGELKSINEDETNALNPIYVYPEDINNPIQMDGLDEITITIPKNSIVPKKILALNLAPDLNAKVGWNGASKLYVQLLEVKNSKFYFYDSYSDVIQFPISYFSSSLGACTFFKGSSGGTSFSSASYVLSMNDLLSGIGTNSCIIGKDYYLEYGGSLNVEVTNGSNDLTINIGIQLLIDDKLLGSINKKIILPKSLAAKISYGYYELLLDNSRVYNSNNSIPSYEVKYNISADIESDARIIKISNDTIVHPVEIIKPLLKEILVENRLYYTGQYIPIRVKFSGLVNVSHGGILTVNGHEYSSVKNYDTNMLKNAPLSCKDDEYSSCMVFLYKVEKNSNTNLSITSLKNIYDIQDNLVTINDLSTYTVIKNCTLVTTRMVDAIQSIQCDEPTLTFDENNKPIGYNISINVTLDQDSDYEAYYTNDSDISGAKSVYAVIFNTSNNNEVENSHVYLSYPTGDNIQEYSLSGNFTVPLNLTGSSINYIVQLYVINEGKPNDPFTVLLGDNLSATASVESIVFVDPDDIILNIPKSGVWPSGIKNEIYFGDVVELGYEYIGSSTFCEPSDFQWVISESNTINPIYYTITTNEIASIDPPDTSIQKNTSYYINSVNNGTVYIGLTALNRNVDTTKNVTKYIDTPVNIIMGNIPILTVLNKSRVIIDGSDALVAWGGTVISINESNSKETYFTLDLYNGNYDMATLNQDNFINSWSAPSTKKLINATFFTIPTQYLTSGVSTLDVPKYTVVVSVTNPYNDSVLKALVYIIIRPQPTKITLTELDSYYFVDINKVTGIPNGVVLQWTITNFIKEPGSIISFHVEKNGVVIENSIKTEKDMISIEGIDNSYEGSYSMIFDMVNSEELKDIYTVIVTGKNSTDETTTKDSFILHVYSGSALKLFINNNNIHNLTLDNHKKIESLSLSTLTTKDIMGLTNEITLNCRANINVNNYNWNNFNDLFMWKTSNNDIITINWMQKNAYVNLATSDYIYFNSKASFALSGIKDGTAVVSVTHSKTNMTDESTINIITLTNQFFIFQFYPMTITNVKYINGNNERIILNSNSDGILAIYEPSGIKSDIHLQSQYIDSSFGDITPEIYLGTLQNINILSGERDSTQYISYPINTFQLRRVARVTLYVKKEDATPYSGGITLYGGVYKNGCYCQNALINGQSGVSGLNMITGLNGKIVITMDTTEFWSSENGETQLEELVPDDNLQFIYEIHFENDEYYPELLFVDGNETSEDIIKFADSVVNLIKVPNDKKNKPFIVTQTIQYGNDSSTIMSVKDDTNNVGPSTMYPEVILATNMLLWGVGFNRSTEYSLNIVDQYGVLPNGQVSSVIIYPFSTMLIANNVMTMTKENMWINPLDIRIVSMKLCNSKGTLISKIPISFCIVNMIGIEDLGIDDYLENILDILTTSSLVEGVLIQIKDDLIRAGLNLLTKMSVSTGLFKMLVGPTKNPGIYSAYIWAGNQDGFTTLEEKNVYFESEFLDVKVKPSVGALMTMAKGKYKDDVAKKLSDALYNVGKLNRTAIKPIVGVSGYFSAQIEYDYFKREWNCYVLGGGFTAEGGVEVVWTYNAMVGYIPVTAYIKAAGAIGVDFKAAVRYFEGDVKSGKKDNDYLTTLEIRAYVKAFAGIGFDYTVVALKIGLFGKIDLNFQNAFLNLPYKPTNKLYTGQYLNIVGTIGIEFVAVFLFFTFEVTLASVSFGTAQTFSDWDYIHDYWKKMSETLPTGFITLGLENKKLKSLKSLKVISNKTNIQKRDYLERYERFWNDNSIMAFGLGDSIEDVKLLQQNAYPVSSPMITNDGVVMIYLSDNDSDTIADTRIYYTTRNQIGEYPEGNSIPDDINDFTGFGDCTANIYGTENFAVVAWVRLRDTISKNHGEEVTLDEQLYMVTFSEIMLSVYEQSNWKTIRVTDNNTADLAPVVASNGERIMLAWRSVYAGNSNSSLDFSTQDHIQYCSYNKDTMIQSSICNLYNGTSGSVKGISIAMLEDGTSCVVYSLDLSSSGNIKDYEIIYAIIDNTNNIIKTVRLTADKNLNENPQVTTATIDTNEGRREVFVLAWHTVKTEDDITESDIRLSIINSDGTIYNNFFGSINESLGVNKNDMGSKYKFTRIVRDKNDITNISVVWCEPYLNIDSEAEKTADKDVLKVVRFIYDNNSKSYILSAPIELSIMPDNTLIDSFDVFVSNAENYEISSIILATNYPPVNLNDERTYRVQMHNDTPIYLSNPISNMYTMTKTLYNSFNVSSIIVDYNKIYTNAIVPIIFNIVNTGVNNIDNIEIVIGQAEPNIYNSLNLKPNGNVQLVVPYLSGSSIIDEEYEITADFEQIDQSIVTGTVFLNYPDVGISKVEIISEEDGLRVVRVTLYNGGSAKLKGSSKKVILGAYSDAERVTPFDYLQFADSNNNPFVIEDDEELSKIDEGHYTVLYTFNIKEYIGDGKEISDGGIIVFLNTVIVDSDGITEVPEIDKNNNQSMCIFYSLVKKHRDIVSITTDHEVSDGKSSVEVTIQNNSLVTNVSGVLVVCLLDENGNVIECYGKSNIYSEYKKISALQEESLSSSYLKANQGLLILGEEEVVTKQIQFSQPGYDVSVYFGQSQSIDEKDASLYSLSFSGIVLTLADFIDSGSGNYTATTTIQSPRPPIIVTAIPDNPQASININGLDVVDGILSVTILDSTTITIIVTSQDGTTKYYYTLFITVVKPNTPIAPVLLEKTDTTINLINVMGQEYSLLGSNNWQDSSMFTSLTQNTQYTFVTRVKMTETSFASEPSASMSITTKLSAQPAPLPPKLFGKTDTSITIYAESLLEYSIDNGLNWVTTQLRGILDSTNIIIFENLLPNNTYAIIARIKYDLENQMESISSEGLNVTTKLSAKLAPQEPQLYYTTEYSITIYVKEEVEYSINKGGVWISINTTGNEKVYVSGSTITVMGLSPYTQYSIVARYKFNEEVEMDSMISKELFVITNHIKPNIKENKIIGIYNHQELYRGEAITFYVSGCGMDINNPVVGDSRLVPYSYCVSINEVMQYVDSIILRVKGPIIQNNKYAFFNHHNNGYISGESRGDYVLEINIIKEYFTDQGWIFTGESYQSKINFRVI